MPISIHPYFRDKERAMESCSLIQSLDSTGYTAQEFAEDAGTQPAPNLLDGSNWFFGGTIGFASGQGHND